nr:hypothetical protein [Tanacetum cinerariifolium]
MSSALQKQFESYPPQLMLDELRKMFEKPQAVEIYDLLDALHSCKQALRKFVSAHVVEMKAGHWKRNCPLYLEELRKNKDKAEHDAAAL